jgi:hypothetical protein
MRKIVFNGKFRAQRMTGVQRVAEELITALGTLKLSDPSAYGDLDLNWAPPRGAALQSIAGVNQIDAGRQGRIQPPRQPLQRGAPRPAGRRPDDP